MIPSSAFNSLKLIYTFTGTGESYYLGVVICRGPNVLPSPIESFKADDFTKYADDLYSG